ncbi:DUF726-domain-containing protein [Mollisia scopiformis]|uniref:DUF726-domain-containing protein n=1 Tax=Mollisia scopiformis TaxID=149040 RepID=A0A132B7R4_MOLSC|nr:DUF726-domain-containing protein [Mollisia scopiformis]KUJ08448.1 DUF726-domain-containing protein [Mollisia scopiformis]
MPSATDPKDLKLLLNPARRKALTSLIAAIVSHMRTRIEQSFDSSPQVEPAPLFVESTFSRDLSPSPSPQPSDSEKRLEARLEKNLSNSGLHDLKKNALFYFDAWAAEVRGQYRKTCDGPEDPRSDQRRKEWMAARTPAPPPYSATPTDVKDVAAEVEAEAREVQEAKDVSTLQSLYHPIPTRLTTIPKEDRVCVISCMVLLLLSLGHYSAHSRVLLCYLTSAFAIPLEVLTKEETDIAKTLILASKALTADAETKKRQAENASSRRWKVGLASVTGAAVIGLTGGLAAPVVAGAIGGLMGGVGLGGLASFLGIFAMNGALVGSLFGAFGGKMTGEMVDTYAKEVSDFKFLPIASEWGEFGTKEEAEADARRLRVTIGINGWLNTQDDVVKPWRVLGQDSEVFALRYEMDALLSLGLSLQNMVSSYAWSYVKLEILKRTVLATLWSAIWPVYLLKMATSIDNPFAIARNRSEKAGRVLADALINRAQGERPVTLIGYSLGSRVIYSCLKSLAERQAFGLVENVIFIGSPIPSNSNNWRVMRSVVSGKMFNIYSENDYILAFLYRATSIQFGVAGLQEIGDVEGIENMNLSKEVSGHLRYPELIGKIMKRTGIEHVLIEGTEIESDSTEIQLLDVENPDTIEQKDTKSPHQMDLLGLMDTPLSELEGDNGMGDLTRSMGGLDMSSEISAPGPSFPTFSMNSQPLRPDGAHRSMSDPSTQLGHPTPPGLQSRSTDTDILNITQSLNSVHVSDPPSYSRNPAPKQDIGQYDSDSDDGGILMVDNASDGDLAYVPSVPMSDDWNPDPRDTGKVPAFEEQKSLGSFPRHKEPGSQGSRTSGSSGTGSRSEPGGERIGSGNGQGRVSAADLGLY